jgi:hypothetical protein
MSAIKAFVGHSFNDDDKSLVGKFVENFDTLVNALPGFSWDRALEAEPSSVSQKVLEKIRDKNVFIGICTKAERVAQPKALTPVPFWKPKVWASLSTSLAS